MADESSTTTKNKPKNYEEDIGLDDENYPEEDAWANDKITLFAYSNNFRQTLSLTSNYN